MLYLVACDAACAGEAFFSALDSLGQTLMLFRGAFLLDTSLTAVGVRLRLLPYADGCSGFAVVQMFRGHCAGRLNAGQKAFIRKYIQPDPALRYSAARGHSSKQK